MYQLVNSCVHGDIIVQLLIKHFIRHLFKSVINLGSKSIYKTIKYNEPAFYLFFYGT